MIIGLPQEASCWEKITVLNLKNNKLTDIGSLPQSWPLIERLYLGANLMTTIPFEIGTCLNLFLLDLSL